jgi:hypothetical protein
MWRGAMAANLRYYEAWGRIASQWLRELADAGRVEEEPGPLAVRQVAAPTAASPGSPSRRATASNPALVLEGRVGEVATGAFLVENHLGHPVETPVIADEVTGPGGEAVPVSMEFEPAVVSLAAEERCVVRVRLAVPEPCAAGTDYRTVIRDPTCRAHRSPSSFAGLTRPSDRRPDHGLGLQ